MKKLSLTLLTCLLFLSPNVVLSETMNDLVIREGLYYKKFSDVPFSGVTTGNEQRTFKNGVKDGAYIRYYDNGQVWFKGNHKNGNKEGEWVQTIFLGERKIVDGTWGFEKGNYKNGKKEGVWVNHNLEGQLISKDNFKNGKKISD